MVGREELINDTELAIRAGLDGKQAEIWTAMPALVVSVNLSAMTLVAQPAIQGAVTNPDGTTAYVNLPQLLDVPICFPSAGGFSLTLPVAVGDEVLVIIAARCIDSWWQNGGIGVPMESRMHDLSDGFALPGPRSQPKVVSNISAANVQLRNDAGTVYVEITPSGQIHLVAPSGVGVTGNLNVSGAIVAAGEITSGIIPLSAHLHLTVAVGSNTGPALP